MAAPSSVSSLAKRLQGKVALITGGASGIGQCTAKLFARHGAKVAIADIQDELGHSVITAIGPSNSLYLHCDVACEDHVRNAVDATVSAYGKLDIMFNNAAIADKPTPRIADNEGAAFARILTTNVTGVFHGMKHAARVMVPARRGSIISTASTASRVAGHSSHAYVCSKHAVVGLTRSVAIELGQFGIRVNCVSPFALATPLAKGVLGIDDDEEIEQAAISMGNLKGAVLKAEDVANAALFLASDEAKYVSGHNLFVDGGISVGTPAVGTFKYPDP